MKIVKLDIAKSIVRMKQLDTRILKLRKVNDFIEYGLLDFIVDGKSLRDLIRQADKGSPELTTVLQDNFVKAEKIKYLKRLLGKEAPDLESGRVALFVCPLDGDLFCNTVACRISFDADYVKWYDFAWDGKSEDEELPEAADDDEEYEKVKGLESFTFKRSEYEAVITEVLDGQLR